MNILIRVIKAEYIKNNTTFMFWLTVLMPVIMAGGMSMLVLLDNNYHADIPARWHITFTYTFYFHAFVFIQILFIGHIHYLEHTNHTWKNLYVLPLPGWVVFFAKLIFTWLVLAVNMLLFYLSVLVSEYLISLIRPELGFQHGNYWLEALLPTLKLLPASTAVTAIMFWISHHFKTLLIPIVLGLTGYASAFVLFLITNRRGYDGFPYAEFHPFNFMGFAFSSFGTGNHWINIRFSYYGLLVGGIVVIIHYWISRRQLIA